MTTCIFGTGGRVKRTTVGTSPKWPFVMVVSVSEGHDTIWKCRFYFTMMVVKDSGEKLDGKASIDRCRGEQHMACKGMKGIGLDHKDKEVTTKVIPIL